MLFQIQASTKHVNESIAKQIHEKAAPVVAWLRTAEEESSGEEEEDEVEVVYSESVGAKGITTVTEKPKQPAEEVACACVLVCVVCVTLCVCIENVVSVAVIWYALKK